MKISRRNQKFLNLCIEIALKSSHAEFRHGAILFKRKDIIAVGMNQQKTHPKAMSSRFTHSLHAEEHAIVGVDRRKLHGATLIVCRVNPIGDLRVSKPCRRCEEIIRHVGIRRVIYSDTNSWKEQKI